ncbi:hypothetical protein BSFA1_85070 (plasmid) [Burkholderia sp. SFA1]|uniref:hypothetical protein n=1 Tax=unclassified Caballeronia TaxID=2646786 RepID=UPI0005A1E4D8|nr:MULTISPECIES: hypothetical protein [unclassified Caballeronia]MCE4547371.1 hypothetical protein [Caballeronia sp. PC1]MCE4575355.1 hypothetical protein [Caballeronia sp. CLC5]BBQ03379.1 hypothetical protein BSFA1_85070 [Burkholderia sp. SFA1]
MNYTFGPAVAGFVYSHTKLSQFFQDSLSGSFLYPGGQFNFPYLWARKFPHPVKQDEIVI